MDNLNYSNYKGDLVQAIEIDIRGTIRINPTMIWGQTCITMLGDNGKPLSGDKGTRTENHGPKIQQGIMARVRMNIYAYELDRSAYCTRSKR